MTEAMGDFAPPASWFESVNRFKNPVGATRSALFIDALMRYQPGRLLDLGAGHGTFSRLAADLGWTVTAVDARANRIPEDERVTWMVQDIRDTDLAGFDLIACLGLWYHLTLDDQVDLARRAGRTGAPLLVDTHVAVPKLGGQGPHAKRLSDMQTVSDIEGHGYRGRLFFEGDIQHSATASFGNENSFWPTPQALRDQLHGGGYDVIETWDPLVVPARRYFFARQFDAATRARMDSLIHSRNPLLNPPAETG